MFRKSLIVAACLVLATPLMSLAEDFKPDPAKKYYIDCTSTESRVAGGGPEVSQWGYTVQTIQAVKQTETGENVEWKFVAAGDKWHIQLAKGGDAPRLWAVKLPAANGLAMAGESKDGGWTQFTITSAGDGKSYITCTEGPDNFKRLNVNGTKVGTTKADDTSEKCQFTITEVKSE